MTEEKREYNKLKNEKVQLQLRQAGIGAIGTILGWGYVLRTGGGFLRYIGFGIMGGIALGSVGYFTIAPKLVNIQFKMDELKQQMIEN